MKRFYTLLVILSVVFMQAAAAKIDTIMVKSKKMGRSIEVTVVTPKKGLKGKKCPVIYLLHGYNGNNHSWLKINKRLPVLADRDGIMIVCPNGENSWYWDSPLNPKSQFETFVSKELVDYIDHNYPTIARRESRAITGLSMGGHGGLWLSFRHKDVFGAAGSTSGGVDIRPFPKKWEMSKQLGIEEENQERWDNHTVMTQLDKIQNGDLAIIFDCGWGDFFFEVNNKLHEALKERGIFHDFIIRPGIHNPTYWSNSIEYQWLFFTKFFKGYRTKIK